MSEYLESAMEAAQAAGGLLRAHYGRPMAVDVNEAHDIKLELDRRSQTLIESLLLAVGPLAVPLHSTSTPTVPSWWM